MTKGGKLHRDIFLEIDRDFIDTHREPWWIKIPAWHDYTMALLDFHSSYKNIKCCSLKHSNFWTSADVKPTSNDWVHGTHCHCMFALSMFIQWSLCSILTCYYTFVISGPIL
jgi:hypothetical protein